MSGTTIITQPLWRTRGGLLLWLFQKHHQEVKQEDVHHHGLTSNLLSDQGEVLTPNGVVGWQIQNKILRNSEGQLYKLVGERLVKGC